MLVREYKESDLDALRAIHAAQGFDYVLPDLRNPLFVTKLVLSEEIPGENIEGNSRILGAALLRLTAGALAMAPRVARSRPPRRLAARPRRRPRLAAAAHRAKIRSPPRAPRLAPRRRMDPVLPTPQQLKILV